jgi:hypothetical protein
MNVLCGLFLYVMPEVDAFFTFNSLLTRHCPGYITPNLDGVHVGCQLVDRALQLVRHLYVVARLSVCLSICLCVCTSLRLTADLSLSFPHVSSRPTHRGCVLHACHRTHL